MAALRTISCIISFNRKIYVIPSNINRIDREGKKGRLRLGFAYDFILI